MAELKITVEGTNFIPEYPQSKTKEMTLVIFFNGKKVSSNYFVSGAPYPLTCGSGTYTATVYTQKVGVFYNKTASKSFKVKVPNVDAYMLGHSIYVPQTATMVEVAQKLRAENEKDEDYYSAVKKYIRTHFYYDYIYGLQTRKQKIYFPDLDRLELKKSGICQDLAAYAVGLLREGGVPANIVLGYADKQYHAWVKTEFGMYDPTPACGGGAKAKKYIEERKYQL